MKETPGALLSRLMEIEIREKIELRKEVSELKDKNLQLQAVLMEVRQELSKCKGLIN